MNNIKVIDGIWIVEKKYDLIWLKDTKNNISQTLNYFKFQNILYQDFTEDQVKKIMESLNCEEKLLIDFSKEKVKKIELKDIPFTEHMKTFMNANAAEQNLSATEDSSEFYNF